MSFWQDRIVAPLKLQLTQGVTPERLAFTCAMGAAIGVFPILGSTTLLCLLVGVFLKLNQPAIQAVNYLAYPAQLALLPVFVRAGEKLFQAEPVALSPVTLTREFAAGPGPFLSKYGMAGVHGITAWAIAAPIISAALYFPLRTTFQKMTASRRTS